MKELCYIGIDSGGSHCKGVLITSSGSCLATAEAGPCSVTGTPFDLACSNLKTVIQKLLTFGDGKHEIAGLFAGISGCGVAKDAARFDAFLHQEFPDLPYKETGSDALNPLYACIGNADGIIAICGTGSGAYAHIHGNMYRVDLDGYLFGDEAGGYSIGRNVIRYALRMQDGRVKKTVLYDLCAEYMQGKVRENLYLAYDGGKQYVASLCPIAFQAMKMGDETGKAILDQAVANMAEVIQTAGAHFPSKDENIAVVTCGSLWMPADGYFLREVGARIGNRYVLQTPSLDSAFGAAVYAAATNGLQDTNALIENLTRKRGK